MTFEFLWTDICFLVVLSLGFIGFLSSLRKKHVRDSFSLIIERPLAVSAGVILLFFLSIGVLDSIHLRSTQNDRDNVTSLLDRLLSPLDTAYEKTYSAPIALRSFVTETEFVQGQATPIYPRLTYPPVAIKTQSDIRQVVAKVLKSALGYCFLVGIVLVWATITSRICTRAKKIIYFSPAALSSIATIIILTFASSFIYELSRAFHVLGTGQIGQDILYYSLKSIRTGLIIGLLTTLFMLPLALFLGIAAGYFGGIVDDIIQYIYTTLSSIPGVLLITASVLSLQIYITNHPTQFDTLAKSADARLLALCFILGITSWTSLCRLLRAEALKLRSVDFVLASRALGSSWFFIIRKHLLPNVMHIVVITTVLDFSFLVMAEALLSYVGVGVSPMTISWGNMINSARSELARDPLVWWPMCSAFVFMSLLVLCINLFADAVRDAFDPYYAKV